METRPRLVYVVTHPVTADVLLHGQLAFMQGRGFDVTVVTSPGPELDRVKAREGVRAVAVPMERPIRPLQDAISLAALTKTLRSLRPHIVNASTPKAGLLGMIAARAIGVPIRIYLLRGLRLETTTGNLRRILSATERMAAACADEVVCNSASLLEVAVRGGHIPRAKSSVIGGGASNGIDPQRWVRTPKRMAEGRARARAAGIADDEQVIGFVGRFDPDKGIVDLVDAFERLRARRPKTRLMLVGGGLAGDLDPAVARRVEGAAGVVAMGKTNDLAPLYARMDVLAFPSYREGFPNVPLEAASAEVPAVGYRSTGVVDAIADGQTGLIVAQRDVAGLATSLERYLADDTLRAEHGRAARARAIVEFSHDAVWRAWEAHYRARLSRAGI